MTSQQLIRVVRSVCNGSSVCCTTAEWYHSHLPADGCYETTYALSLVPGLGGQQCTRIEGRDWQHCADQLQERITILLENGLSEPQADVTVTPDVACNGDMHRAGTCVAGSSMPLG